MLPSLSATARANFGGIVAHACGNAAPAGRRSRKAANLAGPPRVAVTSSVLAPPHDDDHLTSMHIERERLTPVAPRWLIGMGLTTLLAIAFTLGFSTKPRKTQAGPSLGGGPVAGAEADGDDGGSIHARARLIAESDGVAPGSTVRVAVAFNMDLHWHIYWRNGGDAGMPTTIDWTVTDGVEIVATDDAANQIAWPVPMRVGPEDVVSYGYEGTVAFVATLSIADDVEIGTDLVISADATWLVCHDDEGCIPGEATLTIALPVVDAPAAREKDRAMIEANAAAAPADAPEGWTFRAAEIDGQCVLVGRAPEGWSNAPARGASWFYPYADAVVDYAAKQAIEWTERGVRITVDRPARGELPADVAGVLVGPRGWTGDVDTLPAVIVRAKLVTPDDLEAFASER